MTWALALALLPACLAPARAAKGEPTEDFRKNLMLFMSKCGKCHTVGEGDRVGPDLKGVTKRRSRDWLEGFIAKPSGYLDSDPEAKKLLEKFDNVRMDDLSLSPAQVSGMIEVIEAFSEGTVGGADEIVALEEDELYERLGMPEEGMSVSVAGVLGVMALLLAASLLWRAGTWPASALLILFALALGYWSFGGRRHHRLLGNQQGYSPEQPVAFSHRLHAGELEISCFNCHHGAEKSDTAGVPSLNVCMNCHSVVKRVRGAEDPSPEIAKIASVWDKRNERGAPSISWVRVHDLPDYVHFGHRDHVLNGIQCQECHGPVQEMERLRQASSLSMGWCVHCHRKEKGSAPTHWKRASGPLDCAACHW